MDGEQMFWLAFAFAQFFAQLHDDLIEGARGAVVIVAPNFRQQPVTRQDVARVHVKELQQLYFPGGEFLDRPAALELKPLRVNGRRANLENLLGTALDASFGRAA